MRRFGDTVIRLFTSGVLAGGMLGGWGCVPSNSTNGDGSIGDVFGNQTDAVTEMQSPPVTQTPAATPITTSTNSITTADGGMRTDPEGIAAASATTKITWKDSHGLDRTMTLGGHLYQYDLSVNDNQQVIARSANDNAYGHPGFGYVVSHNTENDNSPIGKANIPTKVATTVFAGAHHAIHRVEVVYDRDKEGGGFGIKIPVVIEWLVATGRDHPVWSVTWKMGQATNPTNKDLNTYRMDVRGPYGSLNFDGAVNKASGDAIGGVAWGDAGFKFITTNNELTLNSPWTYNTANVVNFTREWTKTINAEMGIVQTRVLDKEMGYGDRVVGRERGHTSAQAFTNKGDCTGLSDARAYLMPCVGGWPYQLVNYDWDPTAGKPVTEATGTKLIAWGSPYGYLGSSSFALFDYSGTADGRGDRSYATFIVLGAKCKFNGGVCSGQGDVDENISDVEALAFATIGDVTAGSVVTQIARGPGATDLKNLTNGYNDTYAAYYLTAASNKASFKFTPAAGKPVKTPIFVVQNYTAGSLPKVTVNGAEVTVNSGAANSGAFVSLNTSTNELWVTLNRTITAATSIAVAP